ncbi:hypothetical protein BMF94_3038 [Rhodotorula taiwanensis]|uniref:Peptide N-acetyl-beta-D-glucosaminyl asparaginase amidase A N-terminal domain-containing protein n=1 Tax=Rhodotorula taiwanensis TaxID=741276 RepID=A0A2S5BAS9_9BASI|nr:hypothetical protein BMF94_3038 [Rhodotorula taiwanensis]
MLLSWLPVTLSVALVTADKAQRPFVALGAGSSPTSAEPHADRLSRPLWRLEEPLDLPETTAYGSGGMDTAPRENLQVHHPVLVPQNGKRCTVQLVRHDFANSYYQPAIVDYKPPRDCPSNDWAAVVLNLTVTSNGTQFDRLASLSLSHVEIWRTSTAEPTKAGIIWTYEKDVTRFSPLFAQPGQILLELNNIVNEQYTGIFSVQLSATFYAATPAFPAARKADLILPLTTGKRRSSQMLSYPGDTRRALEPPMNTAEANFFPEAGLIGKGPYREVQVRIDETLVGVVQPFPVIYTGGANPLLWRPLASLRAFDIPSGYLDLTPFLPILGDGGKHEVLFSVLGEGEDNTVNENWFITGAVHVVLDKAHPPLRTTGRILDYHFAPAPLIISAGFPSPDRTGLKTSVGVSRGFAIRSEVETGSGGKKIVSVVMNSKFDNVQDFEDKGLSQRVRQTIEYSYRSTHDGRVRLQDAAEFPLDIATNYTLLAKEHRFSAKLRSYGYNRQLLLPAALCDSHCGKDGSSAATKSSQSGEAEITGRDGQRSTGWGRMEERYSFVDSAGLVYREHVKAENGTVTKRNRSRWP